MTFTESMVASKVQSTADGEISVFLRIGHTGAKCFEGVVFCELRFRSLRRYRFVWRRFRESMQRSCAQTVGIDVIFIFFLIF